MSGRRVMVSPYEDTSLSLTTCHVGELSCRRVVAQVVPLYVAPIGLSIGQVGRVFAQTVFDP